MAAPGPEPLLSIVIPTYNRAALVPAAVSSALAQTFERLEVVVVDDGSTDHTAAACAELARRDPRVRPLVVSHRGLGAARNAGLASARGSWAAFLDDDDLLHPEFADSMLRFAGTTHPACVCEALTFTAPIDQPVHLPELDPDGNGKHVAGEPFPGVLFDTVTLPLVVLASRFPVNTVLVRAELVRQAGGFREGFDPCEDYDLWLRLLERVGAVPILHRPLAFVRQHAHQMSRNLGAMARATLVAVTQTLERRPELWRVIGRGPLRARMGTLHREIAYSALLRGERATAFRAAVRAVRFLPADPRNWAYALLAPCPGVYRWGRLLLGHTKVDRTAP